MKTNPTISLCMIVKDEETNLPACLESVRHLVDEMIVVDTGSNDRTIEIARAHGAAVFHFPWNQDFSAARNETLHHARGEWILYLDADERLDPGGMVDCLRRAAAAPGIDAYSTPIKSRRSHGGRIYFQVTYNVRMFRNYPGIHFAGEVHERVEPFLEKVNARIAQASFFIEHLGYDISRAGEIEKLERNLRLARKQLARDPEDGYALYYLGLTLLGLEKMPESRDALHRALGGRGLTPNLTALILNLLSYHHLVEHDYSRAVQRALESLRAVPIQNTARLFLGFALFQRQEYSKALPHLLLANDFLQLPPERRTTRLSQEHSIQETDLFKMIGMCFLQIRDFSQAVHFLRRYVAGRAGDPEAHRLLGVCALNCQNFDLAVVHLTAAEDLGTPRDSIALPLACAYFQLGDTSRCLHYFRLCSGATDEEVRVSMQILEGLGRSRSNMTVLPSLLKEKGFVLKKASLESLGRLFSCLVDTDGHDALVQAFSAIPEDREEEIETLLNVVESRFAERDRVQNWISFLETLCGDHPGAFRIGRRLGIAWIRAGDFRKAIEVFTRVRGQSSPEAGVDRILAGLFVKVGDIEKARHHLALSRTAAHSPGR